MTAVVTSDPPPIPVTVLTGFLGSGKTTLLSHLLQRPGMTRTAVVINEFGEVGLDHLLVRHSEDNIVEMTSGCLCCTIRSNLADTLRDLFVKRMKGEVLEFDRVVVETTGLADPAPVLHTLMTDPLLAMRFRLDGVVTVVDAVNGVATLDNHFESVKQVAVADRLLLSKTDVADAAAIAGIRRRLAELNPAASVLPVLHGVAEPSELIDLGLFDPDRKSLDVKRWLQEEAYGTGAAGHGHAGDHGHHHAHHDGHDHDHDCAEAVPDVNRHDDRIRAYCVVEERPVPWSGFCFWMDMLANHRGPDLLRVKGIVNVREKPGRPIVIHGVQHVFHPPVMLEAWPTDDHRTRLVFITRDISKEEVARMLDAFLTSLEETDGPAVAASADGAR